VNVAGWVYDHDKQASILPSEHDDLIAAMQKLWESEVGENGIAVALQAGVVPALQMMMGASITYVLTNEAYEQFKSKEPKTKSGLAVVGETSPQDLAKLQAAMDQVRGPRRG